MTATPTRAEYFQDPYPLLAARRAEDPVQWTHFFDEEAWFVTGFREADSMLRDGRFTRQPPGEPDLTAGGAPVSAKVERCLLLKRDMVLLRDPPRHTRLRRLMAKVFTSRMLVEMEPAVRRITLDLIEGMKGRRRHRLIRDFAYPLPILVVCELIGMPEEDRHAARRWSESVIGLLDFNPTPEALEKVADDFLEAMDYFVDLSRRRREEPTGDLTSALTSARDGDDQMTHEEVAANLMFMMTAGHETTMDIVASGFDLLLRDRDQLRRLAGDRALIPGAVEETLRYEPPVFMTSRWVHEDVDFGGRRMREGDFVLLAVGGAHRDPRAFEDPDRFDIARTGRTLGFGAGPHYCVGAGLARLEAEIAIELLARHLVAPELAEAPRWRETFITRGYEELAVEAEIA